MQCEKCKNSDATIHLTEIIKGVKSEVHLCEECARDIGLNAKLSNFTLSVSDMMSFLDMSDSIDVVNSQICDICGTTVGEFKKTGILGCPYCYKYFDEEIESELDRKGILPIHKGGRPINLSEISRNSLEIRDNNVSEEFEDEEMNVEILKKKLLAAVEIEDYEEAACLRDRIRDIEQLCRE